MESNINDLLERFDTKVGIRKTSNDLASNRTHPHYASMYKNCDKLKSKQQQRRTDILINQKSKRDQLLAKLRRFVTEVNETDDEFIRTGYHGKESPNTDIILDESETSNGTSSWNGSNESRNSRNETKTQQTSSNYSNDLKRFRNKVMLSEWLLDRPMDFETDWLLKAVPVGKRCLVISNKGQTVAYSRTGRFLNSFYSQLPGGCPSAYAKSEAHQQYKKQSTIIDCIFVQSIKTFYLLDIISWNSLNLYESEAQFRFFWLKSKYDELAPKLAYLDERNQNKFQMIDSYSACDEEIIKLLKGGLDNLTIGDNVIKLDGLLFFHCRGPYVPGASPLVLWLKPDMIERVLGLKIA